MLWIPESTPPQLSKETELAVLVEVLEEGIIPAIQRGISAIQNECEPLAEYLDRLGFDLNKASREGFWPERMVKIGAGVTFLAYRKHGYDQRVTEDAFGVASTLAKFEGIPEAYLGSVHQDGNLTDLTATLAESIELKDPDGGYKQVMDIGAGCARYYMQQAIAA